VIACAEMPAEKLEQLSKRLPNGLSLNRNSKIELQSLTQAFHVNLTAMGMLAFLVGVFIFYQAMSLSLTQRQPLVGTLRQTGVSGWQLASALLLELLLFVLISWGCGNLFGMVLANQLIPAVSASLADLYDANVGLTVSWNWHSALYSLYMTLLGACLACAWPLVRLLRAQPVRLTTRLSLVRFAGREFTIQALLACAFAVAAIAIYQIPQTQETGYAIIVLMLTSVALLTPFILWKVFNALSFWLKWVKLRWFFADAAASMSYRGVATMAFMLALAANIGVETMVGSFRDTTERWLSQRLAADLYLFPMHSTSDRVKHWLSDQPEVQSVWWRLETEVSTEQGTVQVVSSGDSEDEMDALTIKLGVPNYWFQLHQNNGVLISESMALKHNIRPGDKFKLAGLMGDDWQVVGVYYDYGNPYDQIIISHQNWRKVFSGSGDVALAVKLDDPQQTSKIMRRLKSDFRLDSSRVFENKHIHDQAMKVFDQTFAIAATLGNLTLFIAVFGIFFATLAGEVSRQRHMSLLRCLGISGRELILMGSSQLFFFGVIAFLIAMPLGLALAYLVVDIVIKHSFGWTISLQFIPFGYLQTIALAMLSLIIAGALPVMRLLRLTPIKLLRSAV
ncbi:FtsX-like permease family protein, partial [Vibrio sp.]|uniref:ABC transporter permease n=1 Tax=Vibrio sp. TaxID=678 RepID=UPI003D11E7B0